MIDTRTQCGKAAFAGALGAAVLGACVLAGWLFGLEFLKRVVPGLVAMNPATAVGFIFAGASLTLFLQLRHREDRTARVLLFVARLSALVVALIGLAKMSDLLWGWDLGIDRWLFPSKLGDGLRMPNRMAPNTALNFLLLGSALLVVDVKKRAVRLWMQFAVGVVGMGSLLALLGYGYDLKSFYSVGPFIPMALHTAIAFSMLVLAFLLSHTDGGLLAVFAGGSAGGAMARRLLPAAILVPAGIGWLTRQSEKAEIFHGAFSAAVLAVGNMLVFTLLVCWNARRLYSSDLARKNAELALRDSEERFAGAFEHAPIGVALVAPDGRWLKVNRAMCELVGYSKPELLTRTFQDITHPEDLEADLENVRRMVAGEICTYQMEKRYVHQRGHPITVCLSVSLVRESAGQPLYFISQIQDITERKRAEEELSRTQEELLGISRQAGMAEVATSVLHNVGNVLNSVNVSSTLIADGVRKSKAPNLAKAVKLLRAHEADLSDFLTADPKGKQLPEYLEQLAVHLVSEQAIALKELAGLRKNIEHIKDIVSKQQSYAVVSGVTEIVQVSELVDDALHLNVGSLVRHEVKAVREIADVPPISIEKHKVLQILVNLISNAKLACDESGRTDKQLTVRVTHGDGTVKIAVVDNGVGIPPENLIRIFNHGFTTRKTGHGFGLHSGALAAKQLGGELSVQSDGVGHGATFTLELPLHTGTRNSTPSGGILQLAT